MKNLFLLPVFGVFVMASALAEKALVTAPPKGQTEEKEKDKDTLRDYSEDPNPYYRRYDDAPRPGIAQEFSAKYSFAFGSQAYTGGGNFGSISEQYNKVHYVISPQVEEGILLRIGAEWERFSFGVPSGTPLPNTLQSTALVIGTDITLSDQWFLRMEITPGIYSDFRDISFDDVNMPFVIGASYVVDQRLLWVLGLSINPRRESPFPVLPGAGVRWQFADQWVLNFILPEPRLEYLATPGLTLFAGGEMKGGTFQVSDSYVVPALNNATLDYTEYRLGGGLEWKVNPSISVEVQGGYVVDRDFKFHRNDVKIETDPAPYAQIGLKATF
jgi:hypothetical protein